jgi:hypothetical protein
MMSTDRELIEAAARAAGIDFSSWPHHCPSPGAPWKSSEWDPLTDDGDALRLAVALNIDVINATGEGYKLGQSVTFPMGDDFDALTEWYADDGDKLAATRRAVVRAAAAMAKYAP